MKMIIEIIFIKLYGKMSTLEDYLNSWNKINCFKTKRFKCLKIDSPFFQYNRGITKIHIYVMSRSAKSNCILTLVLASINRHRSPNYTCLQQFFDIILLGSSTRYLSRSPPHRALSPTLTPSPRAWLLQWRTSLAAA